MAFRVETSDEAEQDLLNILEWLLEEGAGEAGLRWFMKLEDAIAALVQYPYGCPLAPENKRSRIEVRQLVYGRKPHQYRVLYNIHGDRVFILRILHGAGGALESDTPKPVNFGKANREPLSTFRAVRRRPPI
jgi:plasmid stabilization system protein ParE